LRYLLLLSKIILKSSRQNTAVKVEWTAATRQLSESLVEENEMEMKWRRLNLAAVSNKHRLLKNDRHYYKPVGDLARDTTSFAA